MISLALLLLLLFPSGVWAACGGTSPNLTAASAAYTDVNDCLTAAVDGDTINVPAGSVTWATKLTWTNKSITLKGAGIGVTVIDANVGTYPCLINLTTKATGGTPAGFTRITGFTFKGETVCGSGSPGAGDALITIQGVSANVRIDHNRIEAGNLAGGLSTQGYVRGLVDNNTFTNTHATANRHPLVCRHTKWENIGEYGDKSWDVASTLGTADTWVFEDNTFDRAGGTASYAASDDFSGCRSAYRYNTWIDYYPATHGTETGGRLRGYRHFELYRNTTTWTKGSIESGIGLRGGTGFVFDNTWNTNDPTQFVALTTLRQEDDGSHSSTGWYTWGVCGKTDHGQITSVTRSGSTVTVTTDTANMIHASQSWVTIAGAVETDYNGNFVATRTSNTTFTYSIGAATPTTPATGTVTYHSPFDGNTNNEGYPCMDQVGRGAGVLISGDGPTSGSPTTPVGDVAQALEPVYVWNNTTAGNLKGANATWGSAVILANRDYYNQTLSFDGTTGMGRGLLSARPETCTTGVGYWATDQGTWNKIPGGEQGVLYKCTSTNTWTLQYTPYEYPHPLQEYVAGGGLGGMDVKVPTAPSMLTVQK